MNKVNISHIAIIPDGNRRWARERKLPEVEGHRISVEKIAPNIIDYLQKIGIKYVTFWGLSTENFKNRNKNELDQLFILMKLMFNKKVNQLAKKNVRIKIIGDIDKLPDDLKKILVKTIKMTENMTGITVIFAINYGGRDEIIRALKQITNYKLPITNINEEIFGQYLDTVGIPDPDIVIRTGKEIRLSGFMSWQSAYSELFFPPVYFPDFTVAILQDIIEEYNNRKRRYGK